MKKMQNVIIAGIVLILIVGAGSFYGGMKYGVSKGSSNKNQQGMAQQFGGANGGQPGQRSGTSGRGGSFINGEILSKDDKSVTIKLQNGGSKIVLLSGSTSIGKTTDGALTDLEVGKNVMVTGSTNTDGSMTAQSIQIRPVGSAPAPTGNPAGTVAPVTK